MSLSGRVVIVTGAGTGLGFEVAKCLCESGCDVILACKDEELAKAAIDAIKLKTEGAQATFMQLDVSSCASVRQFVDEFHATGRKLNAIVTCDGMTQKFNSNPRHRQYSADNFELTMATNHLGHFLLTNLLLSDLKSTTADGGDARVIIVTSSLHDTKTSKQCKNVQPLDIDNFLLFNEKSYTGIQAYKNSRLANLMFAYELSRRVQDSGIRVNAICPGVDPEPAPMPDNGASHKLFSCVFLRCITAPKSYDQAASRIYALLTDEKYKEMTGKYIKDEVETESSEESRNEELQGKVWELSARLVHLDGYEPLDVTPPPVEVETPKKKPAKSNGEAATNGEAKTNGESKTEEAAAPVENGHSDEKLVNNDEGVTKNGQIHLNGDEGLPKTEDKENEIEKMNDKNDEANQEKVTPLDEKKVVVNGEHKLENGTSECVEVQS